MGDLKKEDILTFKPNFNIHNFKEKIKKLDIWLIMASLEHTPDELAYISYSSKKTTIATHPMLFKWFSRIFTYDIPLKLLDFFDTEINKKPDQYWFIENTDLPLFWKFCADNWITIRRRSWRLEKYEFKPEWEFLIYATELSRQYQENMIINWTLQNNYSTSYWTFLSKNMLWMKDSITINQKLELWSERFSDLSKLTDAEINNYLLNPWDFMNEIKKIWNIINYEDITNEIVEIKPEIETENKIIEEKEPELKINPESNV